MKLHHALLKGHTAHQHTQALAATHSVAIQHAHTSSEEIRIYVVSGLFIFAAIVLIYEAVFKRQPHDLKLATGALLMVGMLNVAMFSDAVKIWTGAGVIIAMSLYLLPHGVFRRQGGEIFAFLLMVPAFALLTAPAHYLIPYFTSSVH